MVHRVARAVITYFSVAFASLAFAFAQVPASLANPTPALPIDNSVSGSWLTAQESAPAKRKLIIVSFDQPERRQTCHLRSFTPGKLVCSHGIGGTRTYLPQQILALILPGDAGTKVLPVIGFNVGLGAAIWGTVVLAATCPACAVATGIAALCFFGAAGAILIADDQPDRLLYLAPGQRLSHKLGYVQS